MNIKITIHINIGNNMSRDLCIINNISINIIICIEIIINISILISINILNFKISKYFNTSSTYDWLVNADISAFTLDHVFVNAEISAFTNLHTVVICVNAEIPKGI